jgi:hypothetical protein
MLTIFFHVNSKFIYIEEQLKMQLKSKHRGIKMCSAKTDLRKIAFFVAITLQYRFRRNGISYGKDTWIHSHQCRLYL